MDEARSPNLGFASATVVVRDAMGRWLGDCAHTLSKISNNSCGKSNRDLVIGINELGSRKWQVVLQKVAREANATTHILAGAMQKNLYGSTRSKKIPTDIIKQVRIDGVSTCSAIVLSL
ncbi:hypothetical protein J1N35_007353 [Gossypium stocksii]|uniref:Uncharacterized protein n=1 Tax=Gossypium stocksii TaxID=47602 RepID=A0A9D3W898_9ROSI|nr:hypothetical protein J1N35_007353 [Gossypium stocksii]